jgi:hypothetical protein
MTSPIESNITCEQFADALPELLEREVDEATRARLESHALGCRECGPLLVDLRRLRLDAANLPELTPSRDLWSGIAARIETPVVEITPGAGTVRSNAGTLERWNARTLERSSGTAAALVARLAWSRRRRHRGRHGDGDARAVDADDHRCRADHRGRGGSVGSRAVGSGRGCAVSFNR